ncbi:MAG: 30S ribosomal protein S9 [Minisyncoccia bacterium]|jgi:small subunit ribosomal protein S9
MTQTLTEEIKEKLQEEETQEVITFPKIGKDKYIEGIGRRKTAVARVRIYDASKKTKDFEINVNGKDYKDYFSNLIEFIKIVNAPLRKLKAFGIYKVSVKVKGGGLRGQAEAIRLGLSRALVKLNPEWRPRFRKAGFLTRDPREVERKKYGLKKARKAPQWHKR